MLNLILKSPRSGTAHTTRVSKAASTLPLNLLSISKRPLKSNRQTLTKIVKNKLQHKQVPKLFKKMKNQKKSGILAHSLTTRAVSPTLLKRRWFKDHPDFMQSRLKFRSQVPLKREKKLHQLKVLKPRAQKNTRLLNLEDSPLQRLQITLRVARDLRITSKTSFNLSPSLDLLRNKRWV
jgi:hypothetical protein